MSANDSPVKSMNFTNKQFQQKQKVLKQLVAALKDEVATEDNRGRSKSRTAHVPAKSPARNRSKSGTRVVRSTSTVSFVEPDIVHAPAHPVSQQSSAPKQNKRRNNRRRRNSKNKAQGANKSAPQHPSGAKNEAAGGHSRSNSKARNNPRSESTQRSLSRTRLQHATSTESLASHAAKEVSAPRLLLREYQSHRSNHLLTQGIKDGYNLIDHKPGNPHAHIAPFPIEEHTQHEIHLVPQAQDAFIVSRGYDPVFRFAAYYLQKPIETTRADVIVPHTHVTDIVQARKVAIGLVEFNEEECVDPPLSFSKAWNTSKPITAASFAALGKQAVYLRAWESLILCHNSLRLNCGIPAAHVAWCLPNCLADLACRATVFKEQVGDKHYVGFSFYQPVTQEVFDNVHVPLSSTVDHHKNCDNVHIRSKKSFTG